MPAAIAAVDIRRVRAEALNVTTGGLRAVYRTLELPGKHPLKDAHAALDAAVLAAYSFDPNGTANNSRPTSMTYPRGRVITYDYGTAGSVNDKISRVAAIKDGTTTLEGYSYLGLRTIVIRDRPQPGTQLTYYQSGGSGDGGDVYTGLDRFGRVIDQRWTKGATDTDRFQYTYDKDDNRLTKDVLGTGNPGNLDEAYFYDGLNRLTKVNRGSLASGTITDANAVYAQTWSLDALGNWTSFVTDTNGGGAGGTTTRNKTHNRRNQITSISGQSTPTYDNNGNMLTDEQGNAFHYDAWDRLVSQGSENVRYTYDARGYRTERIVAGVSTYFHYDLDWRLLEERLITGGNGGGGTPTIATYVWGQGYIDSLVERDHATLGRQYAQQDANFNVTSLTDSTGTVQERYVYDPYGTVTYKTGTWGARGSSSYSWQYLHQGGRLDPTTNLYSFEHRDYSATLGRWVSNDPIGYADGMNRYAYLQSSPTNLLDPSGLSVYDDIQHFFVEDGQLRIPPGVGYDEIRDRGQCSTQVAKDILNSWHEAASAELVSAAKTGNKAAGAEALRALGYIRHLEDGVEHGKTIRFPRLRGMKLPPLGPEPVPPVIGKTVGFLGKCRGLGGALGMFLHEMVYQFVETPTERMRRENRERMI